MIPLGINIKPNFETLAIIIKFLSCQSKSRLLLMIYVVPTVVFAVRKRKIVSLFVKYVNEL